MLTTEVVFIVVGSAGIIYHLRSKGILVLLGYGRC